MAWHSTSNVMAQGENIRTHWFSFGMSVRMHSVPVSPILLVPTKQCALPLMLGGPPNAPGVKRVERCAGPRKCSAMTADKLSVSASVSVAACGLIQDPLWKGLKTSSLPVLVPCLRYPRSTTASKQCGPCSLYCMPFLGS